MTTAFLVFFAFLAVSFLVGTTIRLGLVYLAHDENRWRGFWGFFGELVDNRWTRPFFTHLLVKRLARWTIASYVRREDFRRAGDVALAEGLVDEAIDCMAEFGHPREAAQLAKDTGRSDQAGRLYRICIDRYLAADRLVSAAESADEAGFWQEAVRLLTGLENAGSRLRAASLCAQNGEPSRAVEILSQKGTPLDAMRVILDAGGTDFVLCHCRDSHDPVLHHFAAETAWKDGRPELGIEILLQYGHLKSAAQFAHAAGLVDRASDLFERVREERFAKERESRKRTWGKLSPGRPGPFRPSSDLEVDEPEGTEIDARPLEMLIPDLELDSAGRFKKPKYGEIEPDHGEQATEDQ
ncbi:MAG: hypothetical protein ACYTFG_21055 [Planctomycetota bacterium]|jgi:hypothetical protein